MVEGEKDADTLWRVDVPATTGACGAESWRDEYEPVTAFYNALRLFAPPTTSRSTRRPSAGSFGGWPGVAPSRRLAKPAAKVRPQRSGESATIRGASSLSEVPRVKLEREPEGRIKWLEPHEEARLLKACADSDYKPLLAIVTIALETGMRYSEIMGMEWKRVDLSRGVIRLERTKSGRRREVPMRQAVYDVLAGLPGPREGRVWPEQGIRTAWEAAVEQAQLDDWHFHDCRHHFASWFMMRGGNLLALSKILGHAKVSMTEKYAHLAPDHLRSEIARTERAVEPLAGTMNSSDDSRAAQVVDSSRECRGSSEAEQLIRN
jgi:integrase